MASLGNESRDRGHHRWLRRAVWASLWLLLIAASGGAVLAADAGPVTEDNVAQRIAEAKTAEDHEALAAFSHAQAAAKAEQVKKHEAMLKSYDNIAGTSKEIMRQHCQNLIRSYRQQQKEYEELAKNHEALAKALRTKAH